MNDHYTYRRVATNGCELCDPDGTVVGWTVNEAWAAVIVAKLNNDPSDAVGAGIGLPEAACCRRGPDNRKIIERNESKNYD